MAAAKGATVSMRTAWLALGSIAVAGFAGIVAVLTLPTGAERGVTAAPATVAAPRTPLTVAAPLAPSAATTPTAEPAPAPAATPEPAKDYTVTSFIQRPEVFQHGDWIWKDEGVPAGPMLILVDLKTQLLHVFRSGREIGVAVMLYGADDSPTPLGTFPIRWKRADHVSSIFGAPMPYTMNLTGDGIAVHGSNVRWGWGTNGCVGVPVPFAKLLFGQAAVGDKVVIVNGKTPQPGQAVPLA